MALIRWLLRRFREARAAHVDLPRVLNPLLPLLACPTLSDAFFTAVIDVSRYRNLQAEERFLETRARIRIHLRDAGVSLPERLLNLLVELVYVDARARYPQAFGKKPLVLGSPPERRL